MPVPSGKAEQQRTPVETTVGRQVQTALSSPHLTVQDCVLHLLHTIPFLITLRLRRTHLGPVTTLPVSKVNSITHSVITDADNDLESGFGSDRSRSPSRRRPRRRGYRRKIPRRAGWQYHVKMICLTICVFLLGMLVGQFVGIVSKDKCKEVQ